MDFKIVDRKIPGVGYAPVRFAGVEENCNGEMKVFVAHTNRHPLFVAKLKKAGAKEVPYMVSSQYSEYFFPNKEIVKVHGVLKQSAAAHIYKAFNTVKAGVSGFCEYNPTTMKTTPTTKLGKYGYWVNNLGAEETDKWSLDLNKKGCKFAEKQFTIQLRESGIIEQDDKVVWIYLGAYGRDILNLKLHSIGVITKKKDIEFNRIDLSLKS